MSDRFFISSSAIDINEFRAHMLDQACGAYVQFEGWVRDHNEGRRVDQLAYEVYEPLAVSEGNRVIEEAFRQFDIRLARGVHRDGLLALSEPAVVVGVASPHRDAAFLACRYIIDQVKVRLPIWKKEFYSDGTAEWVNCQQCAHAVHG